MELQPYLAAVGEDLARATALADDETREIAARVAAAAEPALRLALVQALSDAAATITAQLDGAVVSVRMDGRDPALLVQDVPAEAPASPAPSTLDTVDPGEVDSDTARVTVRLPEHLKQQAESLATASGQSLNAWIVTAVRSATTTGAGRPAPSAPTTHARSSRRISGWA